MSLVLVERAFESPQIFAELQAREDAVGWCLEQYDVAFRRTYFGVDGLRAVCLFNAPDAESVRATQRRAGVPMQRAYPIEVSGSAEPLLTEQDGHPLIVELDHDEPVTVAGLDALWAARAARLASQGARLHGCYLARGGRRSVALLTAASTEGSGTLAHEVDLPGARVWPAILHLP